MVNQQRKEKAMTQTQTNKPADTIRYGGVKGVIWRNAGIDGIHQQDDDSLDRT